MGIKDKLEEQQHQHYNEQQQTSATSIVLHDRLDGIEKNQREVVTSFNSIAQNFISTWEGMEQTQRLMQQLNNSVASANDSHAKTLTTLATTQSEMLKLLASSKAVQLPDGSTVRAADVSAHALMQKLSVQIQALETMNSRLADEVHLKRAVTVDHNKLAMHLIPRLREHLSAHEHAVQAAFAQANVSVLADLAASRAALSEAGAQVSTQVRRAGEQVEKLGGIVTWRTVGDVATVLLPLSLVVFVVFGTAQTVWAAFGLQPILQTIWGWFLDAEEWYRKLAIAGGAFVVLAAICWLTCGLGKRLYRSYRGY